jgi:hypothetical protein
MKRKITNITVTSISKLCEGGGCCIDKRSSAELPEAINSMYKWYWDAAICYAYLSDVSASPGSEHKLKSSRWFTRGWTLQELLAPDVVEFYDAQ